MINLRQIQTILIGNLEAHCGCPFVPSNTVKNIPPYPYGSFGIINNSTKKGTYNRADTGSTKLYMPLDLTYSFTVQGAEEMECLGIAMKARDYLEEIGRTVLSDAGIVIGNITAITSRDTLLTIEYEYRKGFDVVISLFNEVEVPADEEEIEKVTFEHEVVKQ